MLCNSVLETDPVTDRAGSVLYAVEALAVHALLLPRLDQTLDHSVLQAAVRRDELLLQAKALDVGHGKHQIQKKCLGLKIKLEFFSILSDVAEMKKIEAHQLMKSARVVDTFWGILSDLEVDLPSGSSVLDLGCGRGGVVRELHSRGYDALGTDLVSYGYVVDEDVSAYFSPIVEAPYQLPFRDSTFDLIITNQVIEHVTNTQEFLSEISRVLRPGAISLHIYPSRYRFIEPHIRVPLAGMFSSMAYLRFWAAVGIRTSKQKEMKREDVAIMNFNFMKLRTKYVSNSIMSKIARKYYSGVQFYGEGLINHGQGRANRYLKRFIRSFPVVGRVYGEIHSVVLVLRK